ncbi:MAG: permease [Candidatus Dormibacteraceae bacterium]
MAVARDTHLGISNRVFDAVGPIGTPVRLLHDTIARGTYAAVGAGAGLGVQGLVAGLGLSPRLRARLVPGPRLLGVLNGAFGDHLEQTGNELALAMTMRVGGRDLEPTRERLAAAHPAATERIAVLLHGLGENETDWRRRPRRGGPAADYGSRLATDLGHTPLYVRYNSGLHVSANGRRLADLMAAVVDAWPTPVREVTLIGHSMGGLVARSACHQARLRGDSWVGLVRHIACLGTPHHGAPLEKAANIGAWALAAAPETRGIAKLANARSAGVKDLRFGNLVDTDWLDRDPDALLSDHREEIPFLPGASHYFIAAALTADAGHPAGRLFGDLLVRLPSASGQGTPGRHLPFEIGRSLGGLTHFDLLNDPDVYAALRSWIGRPAAARSIRNGRDQPAGRTATRRSRITRSVSSDSGVTV